MIPAKAFASLEPALILPEVKNPENWRGGGMEFVDKNHQLMVMTLTQQVTLTVNPNMVKPEEFTSYRDLLDPKWKGKIVLDDPRKFGPGLATFVFFYLHPDLGPKFIRALAAHEPLILNDFRQEVDFVAQGKYPILLGGQHIPARGGLAL